MQPFVARYTLRNRNRTVPIAPVMDWFVPIVLMAPRDPYDFVFDGVDKHRESTRVGSFAIRDRRIEMYNDNLVVDNVSFYIPRSDLAGVTDRMQCPRIEALPSLLDRDHYDPIMFHFAKIMECALARPSEASVLFLDHMFEAVCIHIAKTYAGLEDRHLPRRGGLSPRQEARIKALLLNDLRGNIGLKDLAASCDMSRGHFIRAFKQSFKFPPHRWLLIKRIERAQSLLRCSEDPISQIALECGFADQSHLTRVFSKSVGVSPAVWRRDRRD